MYFKAKKGTVAFKKITEFLNAIHNQKKANIKALEDHCNIKFTKYYGNRNIFSLCGKIRSIKPDPRKNPKDQMLQDLNLQQDWTIDKWAEKEGSIGYYRPNGRRRSGKMIIDFMSKQKDFTFEDDNKLHGINRKDSIGGNKWSHSGYTQKPGYVLVEMNDDMKPKLLPGMVEITITEYKKLKGKE